MTNDTKPIPAGVLPELPKSVTEPITTLKTIAYNGMNGAKMESLELQIKKAIRAYATEAVKQSLAHPDEGDK
jgi:hypothetical protein